MSIFKQVFLHVHAAAQVKNGCIGLTKSLKAAIRKDIVFFFWFLIGYNSAVQWLPPMDAFF